MLISQTIFLPTATTVVSAVKKAAVMKLARIIVSALWLSSDKIYQQNTLQFEFPCRRVVRIIFPAVWN